jgi:hypothetical protein
MKRFHAPNLPPKQLWRNFDVVGAKVTADDNIIFSPNQLNNYFTEPQPITNISSSSGFVFNSNNFSTNINDHDNTSYSINVRSEFSLNNTYDLEVFNAICQIKSNVTGIDGVPIKFLRILLPQVLPYITHVFNTILTTFKFPMAWRTSKIVPQAKKNEPVTLSHYRPISILPALSKAMEVIVKRQINGYIKNNGLLCWFQSGFWSNHSTCSALLKITNVLLMASEAERVSVMLLLDFSKSFDSVDHDLLCAKLADQYVFSRNTVSFIRSYLSQRMQCVWVNGNFSEYQPVTAGVVQDLVLGALLFSLFINDIVGQISSSNGLQMLSICHLYANDAQLYLSSNPFTFDRSIARLNEDLDRIHQWSMANQLIINSSKSQAMIINPSLLPIDVSPLIKLGTDVILCYKKLKNLGLLINQDLTWVNKICRNVS